MNPPDDNLASVLARHAIDLPEPQVALLARYCELLWEWNGKLNLTRHTDYERFIVRDVVDSLTLAGFLERGERVLDVGSGGGTPGAILAVVRDDLQISLCESVGKKARALSDIVERLGLPTPVLHARAEDVLASRSFDTLVIRAVARLRKLLGWFEPHWHSFGRMLVVKGPAWVEERAEARHHGLMNELSLRKLAEYPLAGTESMSVLLQISRKEGRTSSAR
ncbi:MAG: 16S rRNA (guanine(527)-N(7))-methyltransferase RsmG [Pirellulaceae bacterium]|nr:16S rRNA (guanine(527)-N(7))-methyltransferase RsmG [Pirellulaceae bacterium]